LGTSNLRVISRKAIREFTKIHSDPGASLAIWYKEVRHADWNCPAALLGTFRDADIVGGKVVFNIAGNRYRLIAWVGCRARKVFIKAILTHKEYDKENWK
jgi:mRNA interferase HigB